MLKELSLDNGIHFVDLENLTSAEKEKINEYWHEITNLMDAEDMETANDITEIDTTDALDDKIQYLKDYLSIAKDNLILG